MSEEQPNECALRQDCIKAFEHADEGSKGFLTREDYKVAVLELLGYKPSKYELESVWKVHVCQQQQESTVECLGVNKDRFLAVMFQRLLQKDQDELIRQVFVSFDNHLNGFITLDDCKQAFHEVAPVIKAELIETWFSEVDSDGDERVTYRDFELMMKSFVLLNPPKQP